MPLTSGAATEADATSGRQTVPPVVAYVLLWFPLSSETFIFREVVQLRKRGMPVFAYSMYGENLKGCSEEMRAYDGPVGRMGIRAAGRILAAFGRALRQRPGATWKLTSSSPAARAS